jgi:hypothetical protein
MLLIITSISTIAVGGSITSIPSKTSITYSTIAVVTVELGLGLGEGESESYESEEQELQRHKQI